MPTRHELQTLVDYERAEPAGSVDLFPDMGAEPCWSSTPLPWFADLAWYVDLRYGEATFYATAYRLRVRAVRGGRCDRDLDGVPDSDDNCPDRANGDQADLDRDGRGDVCDPCPADRENDRDGDGVCGDRDNCPATANALQWDQDNDGTGDACEPDACALHSILAPDDPRIGQLRRVRDSLLADTVVGRELIAAYYRGDTARFFATHPVARSLCRSLLDPFVALLAALGPAAGPAHVLGPAR